MAVHVPVGVLSAILQHSVEYLLLDRADSSSSNVTATDTDAVYLPPSSEYTVTKHKTDSWPFDTTKITLEKTRNLSGGGNEGVRVEVVKVRDGGLTVVVKGGLSVGLQSQNMGRH